MNLSKMMGDVLLARIETEESVWEAWAIDESPAPDVFALLQRKGYRVPAEPFEKQQTKKMEEENNER